MQFRILAITVLAVVLSSFNFEGPKSKGIEIQWTTGPIGDFSFITEWEYPEGVYVNQFGQLSCDGFCPERTDLMKDDNGMILKDSLTVFYQLVDTTHIYQSIKSEVNMYEYSGTKLIEVHQKANKTINCFTLNNVSTHSSLIIELVNNTCFASVDFNSITNIPRHTFQCENGFFLIDQNEWDNGILKAEFEFSFINDLDKTVPLNWRGLIYKKIEKV